MGAITAERTATRELQSPFGMTHAYQGADSTQFWKGGIVAVDQADGKLKKGATATTLVCVGVCEETRLTGVGNTRKIRSKTGVFGPFNNSAAADAIAADDVGKDCFMVDDQTVALTSGTNTRSKAGKIYDVDSTGVYVAFAFPLNPGP